MKRVLFSAVAVLLVLLLAEGGLRLLKVDTKPLDDFRMGVCGEIISKFDPDLFWAPPQPPPEFTEESGKKPLKIMVLSDSVAVLLGGGVYPDMVQELLAGAAGDRNPQVYNGGVIGYTSYQGLTLFKRDLLKHRPDVVLVNFGWNDHWNAGNGRSDKDQSPPGGVLTQLMQRMRLAAALGSLLRQKRQQEYISYTESGVRRVPLEDYRDNLRQFIQLSKQHKFRLILSTAPYLKSTMPWLPMHVRYNEVVRKLAQQHNLPLVDLVYFFRHKPKLFIDPAEDFVHYNQRGAAIVARAVTDEILRGLK